MMVVLASIWGYGYVGAWLAVVNGVSVSYGGVVDGHVT